MTSQQDRIASAILDLAEAIRELRSVPTGVVYAILLGQFSLAEYELMLQTLKNAKLITVDRQHVAHWTGPRI
jgi:hypothetical protein